MFVQCVNETCKFNHEKICQASVVNINKDKKCTVFMQGVNKLRIKNLCEETNLLKVEGDCIKLKMNNSIITIDIDKILKLTVLRLSNLKLNSELNINDSKSYIDKIIIHLNGVEIVVNEIS